MYSYAFDRALKAQARVPTATTDCCGGPDLLCPSRSFFPSFPLSDGHTPALASYVHKLPCSICPAKIRPPKDAGCRNTRLHKVAGRSDAPLDPRVGGLALGGLTINRCLIAFLGIWQAHICDGTGRLVCLNLVRVFCRRTLKLESRVLERRMGRS